ncbi:MAG: SPASM domain-containing protein [Nitrospiraceae bacterium]|nr:SPASM domain-containing protein [Nitrospiraceae bacterium]
MIEDKDIKKYMSMMQEANAGNDGQREHAAADPPRPGNVAIDPTCDIRGIQKMRFGNNVVIQKDCWLNIAFNNTNFQPMIEIGEGTNIGRRCTISAANKITIGANVLLGPSILISDHNHEYRHVGVPILHQGISTHEDRIIIGDDTWIGTNTVVVGNVRIGRHCVIGANTVVTKDIPDYCVAAGNPCRVIKLFDVASGAWVDVADKSDLEGRLRARQGDLMDYAAPVRELKSLQVEVSSSCNLRCPQCFQYAGGHKKGFFQKTLWDRRIHPVLEQLSDIHLVGMGEPLLCKDFFFFVEDSRQNNVRVHSTSNLQLLNKETAKRIVESGLHELSFSCDGVSKDTYDKIRINGSIETLRNSLGLLNKYKLHYNSLFPKLILNFGGMKSNIHELPQVVEFAKSYRVDLIIAYHNVMYVPELRGESLYHEQELSDRKFTEAKQLADQLGVAMFMPGLFSAPLKNNAHGLYCAYPFKHLYIYSDGRVGPCCMDFPDRYILGNLGESSVEEVWNSSAILRLRKELVVGPSETCRHCVSHGKMDISDPKYLFRFKGRDEYLKMLETKNA